MLSPSGLWLANSASGDGVVIVKLTKGQGAYRARLRVGDVITSINDVRVRDPDSAIKAIERRGRSGGSRLDVLCRGEEKTTSAWRETPPESVGAI